MDATAVAAQKPLARVQTLSEKISTGIPLDYIQLPENRPYRTEYLPLSIPVIDLLGSQEHLFDSSKLLDEIRRASLHWGVFHVINHGIPTRLLNQIRSSGFSFFNESCMPDRCRYACDPKSPASEGYGSRMLVTDVNDSIGSNSVLDWRDYFDHHTLPLSRRNPSNWPDFIPDYRNVMVSFSDQTHNLAQKLLCFISETLDLPSSSIVDAAGETYQNITISYYPPCPQPDMALGLQAHSDMGVITLLVQDNVEGLQVLKDGEWVTVAPVLDAIVILLADQMEIITNGVYKSAQHRVITNSDRERLSVAVFHDPAKSMNICPHPRLLGPNTPPKFTHVRYGDYVSTWYTKGPSGKRNLDALLL